MLGSNEATATIAVKDLDAARQFYEGKLGLKPRDTPEPQVVFYKAGSSGLLVYKSEYAGTNRATAATWTARRACSC